MRFEELADAYLQYWTGRDHHRVTQVKWWKARIGRTVLADVRPDEIRRHLKEYAQGTDRPGGARAPASVNRLRAALSSIYSYGVREGLSTKNPVRSVAMEKEQNHRVRYLSEDERIALLDACRSSRWDKLYLLVLMAMMTGARKGELKSLHWEWIDFQARLVRLERTKNGEPRVLTLPIAVIEELLRHRRPSGLVFESARRRGVAMDEKKPWTRALLQAEISNFRFHDLRHTAASYLAMGGATLLEIAEVLGHKSLQTTKRYAHLSVAHRQAITDRMLGGLKIE